MAWNEGSPFQFSIKVKDIVGEVLARQFRLYYMNELHIKNADWSYDVTKTAKEVLGKDKVFRAYAYGKYPKELTYSGNPNKGCYASLLPGQYCPAQPGDELEDEVFIAQLQNKVFIVKLNAFGKWWWAGIPAEFVVIKPQPFQLKAWKAMPKLPKNGVLKAGQVLPVNIWVDFVWGTGQRSVAFRTEFQMINGKGTVVADEYSKLFIVSRDGDMPEEMKVTLNAEFKLPELLPPGDYVINTVLYYSVP